MNNTNNKNTNQNSQQRTKRPTNFAEALMEIGGNTIKSFKDDALLGTLKNSHDMVMGNYTIPSNSKPLTGDLTPGKPLDFDQAQKQKEQEIRDESLRSQRHREVITQSVFNQKDEQTKEEIKKIQEELKKLAEELENLGNDVQRAVGEEVVSPGSYHISFFEKLRTFIIQLRKRVGESKNWLSISSARKQQKSTYWSGVKKSGTKYMLSQERYMQTQSG